MRKQRNRYAEMERSMTLALITALLCFIGYMIAAGNGILWLKIILAIVAILICGLCLLCLYFNQELSRQRSLWMSVAAVAMIICIVFSLILNFPSPHPSKELHARNACISTLADF